MRSESRTGTLTLILSVHMRSTNPHCQDALIQIHRPQQPRPDAIDQNHRTPPLQNSQQFGKTTLASQNPYSVNLATNATRIKTGTHNKRYNKSALYRFCIEKGLLRRDQIAQTTFYRFIREYDLLAPEDENNNKKRLAFSMKYANQLWQADTMFGPFLDTGVPGAARKQAKLIAFIDDASRVLCHGEFFFEENVDSLVQTLRAAFYKRGIPEQLLVDNGSIYSCQEITLICARLGCLLRHTAVRDAAAKGKIERFFRRVRDQFLIRKLDLSSLAALNRQFTAWVESDYNAVEHDAIGMKPIDRFGMDLGRVRFLSPSEHNDELFYAEATRKVKKDNTFSFQNRRYETPVDLRDKKIEIRYERHHHDTTVIVIYYKGQRMGAARLLDAVANGLLQKKGATAMMIRAFYGLTQDPFDHREIQLLPQQQEIHDTLKVHCQQGGLCLVLGSPGTGKTVIKQSLQLLPENQYLIASVARTLHTYTNTVKILCDAFRIEFESNAFKCERKLIEQAFSLNHAGKCLTTILDDAHLMDLANLRKLRLLFEDFPKNHNLVLIGQPSLLAALDLGVNSDIKSRVTYSVITKRLNPDDLREFLLRELDRVGLGHNTLTDPAIDLIVRSADGVLRKARNLCVGCLIEAVRSGNKTIDIDNVNRVLRQPHWQKESDLTDF